MKVSASGIINFGSFPGKCFFSTGYSFDELCQQLENQKCVDWLAALKNSKYLYDSENAGYVFHTEVKVKGRLLTYMFLILKKPFDFSDWAHQILSHEAIHLVTFNLSNMLDIVKENEAFAYTHTHILDQCYSMLRNKK